jgi:hypothetical protein
MQRYFRNNYSTDVKMDTEVRWDKDNWNSFSSVLKCKKNSRTMDKVIGEINPEIERRMGRGKF